MFQSKLIKKSRFKTLFLASVVAVYSFGIGSQAVFAATSTGGVASSTLVTTVNDLNSIKNNTAGYDPTASTNCSVSGGVTTSSVSLNATGSDAWSATETQPYYVEELVINILQDLAQALKLPASSTVTQDHVEALVAWATEEGGNQGNSNAFNLWNMGFLSSYPQLYVGGSGAANGSTDSFVSFNAAVQAYTIEFTSSEQNRIGSILSQPNSTASQVLNAVASPSNYAGDGVWATDPNYASKLAAILNQTQSDYDTEASVVIGPGATGNDHVPTSQLQYHIGSQTVSNNGGGTATVASASGGCGGGLSPSGSGGNATCPNGQPATGNLAILCDAEQYQGVYYKWGGGHESYSAFRAGCPLTSLPSAANSSTAADPGPCATDCSGLLSVSVDQAFNTSASFTVASDGMMDTSYWKQIPISSAQPGDIVTLSDQTGHVEIVATNENGSLTTMGQHSTGIKASIVSSSYSYWTYAWTWIGPTNQTGTHS